MKYLLYFLAIVLIGCSAPGKTVEKVPVVVQADHAIKWLPEREDVQAGAILVPENHDEPYGKRISITYIVLKAKDTSSIAYPLIRFSGGPGGNSLRQGAINFLLTQPAREDRDIILFDQRGIGYSSALPNMSEGTFDIMTRDANEEEELALMKVLVTTYQKKCEEQNIGLAYYNSIQSAKDVGLLFRHLGYEKYNLMGGSYGTRLGRVVQDMFPEYVHSAVFDSPAPLSGDFLFNRLASYSLALGRIFDYCQNDPNCKKQYPELKDDYFRAIAVLGENPLEVTINDTLKVVINAQDGLYLLRRLLYMNNSRELAPKLIEAYLEGGGSVINQVLRYEYQLINGLNTSMLLSVEKFENFNPANNTQEINERYNEYPLIPTKMGFFDAFYRAGMNWHSASLPMKERKFKDSDIPTLIFVNQFDPVTPPRNGYLFMENLSTGKLLILDEGGHGGGNPQCKAKVINDFMNDPAAILDASCLNIYQE
jgi:pimeloyl-ACP methyl ester carboxylesterase